MSLLSVFINEINVPDAQGSVAAKHTGLFLALSKILADLEGIPGAKDDAELKDALAELKAVIDSKVQGSEVPYDRSEARVKFDEGDLPRVRDIVKRLSRWIDDRTQEAGRRDQLFLGAGLTAQMSLLSVFINEINVPDAQGSVAAKHTGLFLALSKILADLEGIPEAKEDAELKDVLTELKAVIDRKVPEGGEGSVFWEVGRLAHKQLQGMDMEKLLEAAKNGTLSQIPPLQRVFGKYFVDRSEVRVTKREEGTAFGNIPPAIRRIQPKGPNAEKTPVSVNIKILAEDGKTIYEKLLRGFSNLDGGLNRNVEAAKAGEIAVRELLRHYAYEEMANLHRYRVHYDEGTNTIVVQPLKVPLYEVGAAAYTRLEIQKAFEDALSTDDSAVLGTIRNAFERFRLTSEGKMSRRGIQSLFEDDYAVSAFNVLVKELPARASAEAIVERPSGSATLEYDGEGRQVMVLRVGRHKRSFPLTDPQEATRRIASYLRGLWNETYPDSHTTFQAKGGNIVYHYEKSQPVMWPVTDAKALNDAVKQLFVSRETGKELPTRAEQRMAPEEVLEMAEKLRREIGELLGETARGILEQTRFGDVVDVGMVGEQADIALKVAFLAHGILDLTMTDPAGAVEQLTLLANAFGAKAMNKVLAALPADHFVPVTNAKADGSVVQFIEPADASRQLDVLKILLVLNAGQKYTWVLPGDDKKGVEDLRRSFLQWVEKLPESGLPNLELAKRFHVMTENDYARTKSGMNANTVVTVANRSAFGSTSFEDIAATALVVYQDQDRTGDADPAVHSTLVKLSHKVSSPRYRAVSDIMANAAEIFEDLPEIDARDLRRVAITNDSLRFVMDRVREEFRAMQQTAISA